MIAAIPAGKPASSCPRPQTSDGHPVGGLLADQSGNRLCLAELCLAELGHAVLRTRVGDRQVAGQPVQVGIRRGGRKLADALVPLLLVQPAFGERIVEFVLHPPPVIVRRSHRAGVATACHRPRQVAVRSTPV